MNTDTALGILDFTYAPYALGDAITWMINASCLAYEKSKKKLNIVLISDLNLVNSPLQPHVNSWNYLDYYFRLLPCFSFSPMPYNLKSYFLRQQAQGFIFHQIKAQTPCWPSYHQHLQRILDYNSHRKINAFYKKHGFIPKLKVPSELKETIDQLKQTLFPGKKIVTINIRQRSNTESKSVLSRDSNYTAWKEFLKNAHKNHPDYHFVYLGSFYEWERDLVTLPNVSILRTYGLGLQEELALLLESELFMGTSSGFAAAATFSDRPYIITHYEHAAATAVEIEPLSPHYPFGQKNQILSWEYETPEILEKLFSQHIGELPQHASSLQAL